MASKDIDYMCSTLSKRFACQKGFSLIAMALFLMATGLFIVAGSKIYDSWDRYRSAAETQESLKYIQSALQSYFSYNGRYPCPAPLDAPLDSGAFGREVSNDCTAGAIPGTERAQGRDGRWVRTGAVPVRTLNIPEKYSHDSYDSRFIYSVTEMYAVEGSAVDGEQGAIRIVDSNGNNATEIDGNVVQIVYSMGWDTNGAYNINGVNLAPCDPAARSGENCDFDTDATFLNTPSKSTRPDANTFFVHSMTYVPNRHIITCEEANAGLVRPRDTSFLVDSSGSMGSTAGSRMCPANMPGCSRIDVARWALRRVMPAHIFSKSLDDEAGETAMTGFVGYDRIQNVRNNLHNIAFDDPNDANYQPYEGDQEVLDELDRRLEEPSMCPSGLTPLGLHLQGLAERLKDKALADIARGGDVDRPSKITVLSDGLNTNGTDPERMIASWRAESPPVNIQVDIVDMVGNSSLKEISRLTGGKYYRSDNPQALLDDLYDSIGICSSYTPTVPVDKRGCGSRGNWGR